MTRWPYLPENVRTKEQGGSRNTAAVPRKENKYKNVKVEIDGIKFDSKFEAEFYFSELQWLYAAGEITKIERQKKYLLQPAFKYQDKTIRSINYVADFVVTYKDGRQEVIDTKGVATPEYLLKKKLLLYRYPEINFREPHQKDLE